MPSDETLNDIAWRRLFETTSVRADITAHGYAELTADQLNHFGGREPRLMAKIDSLEERPSIFCECDLNILPLNRGKYIVFKDPSNRCYFAMPAPATVPAAANFTSKANLNLFHTLPRGHCTSESTAVDLAFISSLLNTFCGVDKLTLTRRGRFGSNRFSISLPELPTKIIIDRAQIEVDSIYESDDRVVLIEAKMGFREDFHIRQLYYPYMWLLSETTKIVVPILLCYSNGKFQLTEFDIGSEFGRINLIRQEYFVIDESPKAGLDFDAILKHLPTSVEDLSVPFPQANDLDKVIDVVRAADQGIVKTEELCENVGFVPRQADYYRNAARYLGLTDGSAITDLGVQLVRQKYRDNWSELVFKCMLSRPVLRNCILLLRSQEFDVNRISVTAVETEISKARDDLSPDTQRRRASTVRQWLNWLVENCEFR